MIVTNREQESLRVLLSTPDYESSGGIQTLTRNLEHGLENLSHEVRVVHTDSGSAYSPFSYFPRRRTVTSIRDALSGKWVYRNQVYSDIMNAVEVFEPDVIHALHIEHFPALAAAEKQDIPSVLSCHALELANQDTAHAALSKANRIHVVSDFTRQLVNDHLDTIEGLQHDNSTYRVPPSIDVDWYRRDSLQSDEQSTPADGPVVTLSRLDEEYKNIRTVINAWKHLPEEIRNERELVIAGDGPRREYLEEAARDLKNIRFAGYVDEETKRDLLSSAAVFVFVPRGHIYRAEGFGIVYIEAQASGTPVVGSPKGGAPEAVGDGGIVVEDESNPAEVADAVRRLITDDQTRSNSLLAIERRIDRFGIDSVASEHIANYR